MHFELLLEQRDDYDATSTVAVDESYVDLIYGPLVGAIAVLVLRYLHASMPLRASSICSTAELAEATASKPRRMQGPLGRLHRHRLIVLQRPAGDALDATGRIILPQRLPLTSPTMTERLPPMARSIARERRRGSG